MKFLSHRLSFISANLRCSLAWYAITMSWMVLLIPTCKCYLSYRNGLLGLLTLNLMLLLNPWISIKMKPAQVFSKVMTLEDVHLNWLNWFHFLIPAGGPFVIVVSSIEFLSRFLNVIMSVQSFMFLANLDSDHKSRLWFFYLQNVFPWLIIWMALNGANRGLSFMSSL